MSSWVIYFRTKLTFLMLITSSSLSLSFILSYFFDARKEKQRVEDENFVLFSPTQPYRYKLNNHRDE